MIQEACELQHQAEHFSLTVASVAERNDLLGREARQQQFRTAVLENAVTGQAFKEVSAFRAAVTMISFLWSVKLEVAKVL